MRFLRKFLLAIFAVAAIFAASGFLLPAQVQVERSAVIQAEPAAIFPYLNDHRRFNEWSPWVPRDPNAKYEFSGPEQGVGAKMSWRSDNEQVGSGASEIVESVPNERVVTAVDFGEMGKATASFRLHPENTGTKVTWSLATPATDNPIERWFGLLLDRLIGADYEEGLARLKLKVEGGAPGGNSAPAAG